MDKKIRTVIYVYYICACLSWWQVATSKQTRNPTLGGERTPPAHAGICMSRGWAHESVTAGYRLPDRPHSGHIHDKHAPDGIPPMGPRWARWADALVVSRCYRPRASRVAPSSRSHHLHLVHPPVYIQPGISNLAHPPGTSTWTVCAGRTSLLAG